jgi:hypothetical protein
LEPRKFFAALVCHLIADTAYIPSDYAGFSSQTRNQRFGCVPTGKPRGNFFRQTIRQR